MKRIQYPKIGENICNNIHFLKSIAKTKSETKRRKLLKTATSSELLAIVETAINLVKSRFLLKPNQKRKILPHIDFLRQISRIKTEQGARKILQQGKGIPLAPILIPIIIETIRQLTTT